MFYFCKSIKKIMLFKWVKLPSGSVVPGSCVLNVTFGCFLGGLSLHLNHLIGSRVTNYDWPFWTLPFGLFGSNLDTRDLETILGPILVIFEICQFLTIPGPFEYFSENGWSQKIKVFSMKERSLPPLLFSFRRRGP